MQTQRSRKPRSRRSVCERVPRSVAVRVQSYAVCERVRERSVCELSVRSLRNQPSRTLSAFCSEHSVCVRERSVCERSVRERSANAVCERVREHSVCERVRERLVMQRLHAHCSAAFANIHSANVHAHCIAAFALCERSVCERSVCELTVRKHFSLRTHSRTFSLRTRRFANIHPVCERSLREHCVRELSICELSVRERSVCELMWGSLRLAPINYSGYADYMIKSSMNISILDSLFLCIQVSWTC